MNKLYQIIASKAQAMRNCEDKGNTEWQARHKQDIFDLVKELLPSGSGFDSGTKIDLDYCTDTKLVFNTSYHHMNDNGMYDGWTEHGIVVTPSFDGFDIKVTGRDRNEIKSVIADYFYTDLSQVIE